MSKTRKQLLVTLCSIIILILLWLPGINRYERANKLLELNDIKMGETFESAMKNNYNELVLFRTNEGWIYLESEDQDYTYSFYGVFNGRLNRIIVFDPDFSVLGITMGTTREEVAKVFTENKFKLYDSKYVKGTVSFNMQYDKNNRLFYVAITIRDDLTVLDGLIRFFTKGPTEREYNEIMKELTTN